MEIIRMHRKPFSSLHVCVGYLVVWQRKSSKEQFCSCWCVISMAQRPFLLHNHHGIIAQGFSESRLCWSVTILFKRNWNCQWRSCCAGVLTVTERLSKPETSVTDAFATVSLSEPLLSHSQKQRLNPLVVHIHSATKMPSTPVPFAELKTRYYSFLKVFCIYIFFLMITSLRHKQCIIELCS